MGMKGRVPRPREERIRDGKTRNLPEPVRVSRRLQGSELPEPPMELGKAARDFWEQVTPVLADAGVLERIDLFMLSLAASAWGDVQKAQRVLDEQGMFQMGSVGQIREHSALKIKREATITFERLANHLCLSPVARTRLGLAALTAQAMSREMDDLLGDDDDELVTDGEVVEDELVGLPGV
jgi:P27 family predicted phage terminase small subunit